MRQNTPEFNDFNQAAVKELRLVVEIDFPTPLYLASHGDIPNVPANTIPSVLLNVSSVSQSLSPIEGRATIGSMSFDVVDDVSISDVFRAQQDAGNGLNGRRVRLYRGGTGMDWSSFRVEQTQQIDGSVTYKNGKYSIKCADIQRKMRDDIFDAAKTTLASNFDDTSTILNVFDTTDFEPTTHVASFSDAPSGSYFYLKIKYQNGFEIVRASGKTATTFTGCVRGMFGTQAVNHIVPANTDEDDSIEIEEYVYLELPAPAMAYALLTGNIIGGGTLPTRQHLGIDPADVNLASFEDIGTDLFDQSNYGLGFICRFQDIEKTDGKRFIETEVCLLMGAYLVVQADGRLALKRMTGVTRNADYVLELNESNFVSHGDLTHDLSAVVNEFDISWSAATVNNERTFLRRNILIDANSASIHGKSKPLALSFQGLSNERHTLTTLRNRFDALRDRYAGPPLTLSGSLLPSLNDLEVGDIVRVRLPNLRDYSGTSTLDRSMEVQRVSVSQRSGPVSVNLFGSSLRGGAISDEGTGDNAELPDTWYDNEGTELSTVVSIDGSGFTTADATLSGGATTRTIYYYLGDLTISSGDTITITQNAELRVRGNLQINGTIRCTTGQPRNVSGYLGTTFGGRGLITTGSQTESFFADRIQGVNAVVPSIEVENNGGVLVGVPADMRGTGGGDGGNILEATFGTPYTEEGFGGLGGAGGGSVAIVSRGVGFGGSGTINTSGEAGGTAGPLYRNVSAGSGGGGAPGGVIILLDGKAVNFPTLVGNIVAEYGASPISNGFDGTEGKAANTVDLGDAAARVLFVPKSREPYPDYDNNDLDPTAQPGQDGFSNALVEAYIRSATQPATNPGTVTYDFSTASYTPANGWSETPPSGTAQLWVSYASAASRNTSVSIPAASWTTPVIPAEAGTDGENGTNTARVDLFQRTDSATPPATPTTASATYTFSTGVLDAVDNGWTQDNSAGTGRYQWWTFATAASNTATDSILAAEWVAPTLLATDGLDGDDGASVANALNRGRSTEKLSLWFTNQEQVQTLNSDNTWSIVEDTGLTFNRGLRLTYSGTAGRVPCSERVAVDQSKRYRVSVAAQQNVAGQLNFLMVVFYDSNGDRISNSSSPVSDASGWTIGDPGHYFSVINQSFPASRTRYEIEFGAGASRSIPSNAVQMAIGGLIGRSDPTPTIITLDDWGIFEVPLDGQDGQDGQDGLSSATIRVFKRDSLAPISTDNPGAFTYNFQTKAFTDSSVDWSTKVPSGDPADPVYIREVFISGPADVLYNGLASEWDVEVPEIYIPAELAPPKAYSTNLTNNPITVNANADGTGYDLSSETGTHQIVVSGVDETANATHSISGASTKNGLTASINASGVYSLSGASWTSNEETFSLLAVIDGVNFFSTLRVNKLLQGATGGSASAPVQVTGGSASHTVFSGTATATYRFTSNGKEETVEGGTVDTVGDWLISGSVSDYEIRATVNSGDTPSGTIGSWISLASTASWTHTRNTNGFTSCSLFIEIRNATTQTVRASANVSIAANVTS